MTADYGTKRKPKVRTPHKSGSRGLSFVSHRGKVVASSFMEADKIIKQKQPLRGMSERDYDMLAATGMLFEFYPEATDNYKTDCEEIKS